MFTGLFALVAGGAISKWFWELASTGLHMIRNQQFIRLGALIPSVDAGNVFASPAIHYSKSAGLRNIAFFLYRERNFHDSCISTNGSDVFKMATRPLRTHDVCRRNCVFVAIPT